MFLVYNIPNMNPALGVINDGKQTVSVYDRDLGNRRTVITTPEDADAFVTARKEVLKNAAKQGCLDGLLLTVAGTGIGAAINAYMENAKAKDLNTLIDKLNTDFKEALDKANAESKTGDQTVFVKSDILNKDAYKAKKLDLMELFSEEAKEFKKLDVSKVTKKAGKYGALIGGATAAIIGLFIPEYKAEKADKKLTEAFINNNKYKAPEASEEV